MASRIPIIICGQSPQVAKGVIKGLEPEYEGEADIPAILQGKTPQPSASGEEKLGSGNYEQIPKAIVTGGGYDDAAFKRMYDAAAKGKGKGNRVPWLRPDMTVQTPPLGPRYGEHMVGRARECLRKLDGEGRLGGGREEGEDEIVFY